MRDSQFHPQINLTYFETLGLNPLRAVSISGGELENGTPRAIWRTESTPRRNGPNS